MLVAPRRSCFEYDIVDFMAITEGPLDRSLENVVAVWVQIISLSVSDSLSLSLNIHIDMYI